MTLEDEESEPFNAQTPKEVRQAIADVVDLLPPDMFNGLSDFIIAAQKNQAALQSSRALLVQVQEISDQKDDVIEQLLSKIEDMKNSMISSEELLEVAPFCRSVPCRVT